MTDSPSARIVADANAPIVATDSRGRVIKARRLGALDRMNMLKAAGAELAGNGPWIGYATLASMVTDIDDAPQPRPRTVAQIEAAVDRLGDDGLNALAAAAAKALGIKTPDADPDTP